MAITHGDPNGIGPEVALKALADQRVTRFFEPVLVGSAHVLRHNVHQLGLGALRLRIVKEPSAQVPAGHTRVIDTLPGRKARIAAGQTTPQAGALAMEAVGAAVDMAMEGTVDAVVTAPISKHAVAKAGYEYPGHTEFLAQRTRSKDHMMVMVAGGLRIGLATVHIPIHQVAAEITQGLISSSITRLGKSLVRDFGIGRPRIAVLGLNPHAGEGGVLGQEEEDAIMPAIQSSSPKDWMVFGPFPADGFFGAASYRKYDAVLAMYHDQGLIPFKTLAFEEGVNFTAGLPIVRTSPDHGTAFSIAGKGVASPRSLRQAALLAADIVRQRRRQLAGAV